MALYPGCWSMIALLLCTAPLLAAASFTCAANNDPVTCAALGDLFFATNGTGWKNSTGWSSAAALIPTDYCTFAINYNLPPCDFTGALTILCVWHPQNCSTSHQA